MSLNPYQYPWRTTARGYLGGEPASAAALNVEILGSMVLPFGRRHPATRSGSVPFSLTAHTIAGSPSTLTWKEGNTTLGTGASLSTTLARGTHTLTLTADDGAGGTLVRTCYLGLGTAGGLRGRTRRRGRA